MNFLISKYHPVLLEIIMAGFNNNRDLLRNLISNFIKFKKILPKSVFKISSVRNFFI